MFRLDLDQNRADSCSMQGLWERIHVYDALGKIVAKQVQLLSSEKFAL